MPARHPHQMALHPRHPRHRAETHVIGEPINATPLEIAVNRAGRLPPTERAELLDPVQQAFAAFRAGRGTPGHWRRLADANNIAMELARRKIASDHLGTTFAAAEAALVAVHGRHASSGSWTLKATEITALDDAVFVHGIQLDHCSRGELSAAVTRVINRTQAALRGQLAGDVQVVCADDVAPTGAAA